MNKSKEFLISIGILFCAASFLYEYAIDYKNPLVTAIIMILDIALLFLNMMYLSFVSTNNEKRSVINAVLCTLMYFSGLSAVIMWTAEEHASLSLFLVALQTLVYLGPIIIILLPIIYLILEILGD